MKNPLEQYKENMEYTYDDLASQFKVNRSVIQRAIEGAYYSLPPSITETLAYIEGVPTARINQQYEEWVKQELSSINLPPVALDKETSLDDFDIWAGVLLRINGVNFVGETPKLSIARLLKLNVATISNWYSGRTARIPAQILERVETILERADN